MNVVQYPAERPATSDPAVPTSADVVIVGAGLAGLAAARHLHAAGLDVLILESSDGIGGRVRSDVVDGFTIDRGFQVIATAYPEFARLLTLDDLDPRPFTRGLGIFGAGRVHRLVDPREDPTAITDLLTLPVGSLSDRVRAGAYAATILASTAGELTDAPDISYLHAVRQSGLSERTIDRVLRPFLSGVLLEDELATSRRFVELVLRTMLRGQVVIPASGMSALPRTLAAPLPPTSIVTDVQVLAVQEGLVRHARGTTRARAVVVATDAKAAHQLLPHVQVPPMRSVTTLFHACEQAPTDDALLVVDGEERLIANSVVLSNAAQQYAPIGHALVATSVLGAEHDASELDRAVRRRLDAMYATSTARWELVAVRAVPDALPAMPAPHEFRRPVHAGAGIYVAGDHRDTSSIQGALVSGRRAASALLDELGPLG